MDLQEYCEACAGVRAGCEGLLVSVFDRRLWHTCDSACDGSCCSCCERCECCCEFRVLRQDQMCVGAGCWAGVSDFFYIHYVKKVVKETKQVMSVIDSVKEEGGLLNTSGI